MLIIDLDRMALTVIQRNIRKWLQLRGWQWFKLYARVKPLLSQARADDEMKKMEDDFVKCKEDLERTEGLRKELEEQNVTLLQAKNDLFLELQSQQVCALEIMGIYNNYVGKYKHLVL